MKPDQTTQRAVEEHARGTAESVGVVFVHGVGEQTESETVREFGGALLGWLQEWHKRRDLDVTVTTSQLTYGEDDERPARFTLNIPAYKGAQAQTWVLAEAWWASRLSPPGFVLLATWGWKVLWSNFERLGNNVREHYSVPEDEPRVLRVLSAAIGLLLIVGIGGAVGSGELWLMALTLASTLVVAAFLALLIEGSSRHVAKQHPSKSARELPPLARQLGAAAALILQLGLGLGIVLGYPLIALLFLLAQIPISQVQEFILFKTLRFFLVTRLGDSFTFMYDDVQAVHIRNTIPYAIEYLVKTVGCKSIVVVAHSQGTVVAFDALTSGAVKQIASVKALITFGTALEPTLKLGPSRTTRLSGPLPNNVRWVDVWSAFDNVSGAPARVHEIKPHEAIEVTNSLSILTDHGDYFTNFEEFLSLLAQKIELATGVAKSRFDPGEKAAKTWRIRRRDRIFTMVGCRVVAIIGFTLAMLWRAFELPADRLRRDGEALWAGLSSVFLAGDVIKAIDQGLQYLSPLEPGIARFGGLLFWVVVFAVFYAQLTRFLFGGWHARESDRSTEPVPDGDHLSQRLQVRLRSIPALSLTLAAALMIAALSPLAPCMTLIGCDWVFLGLALLLFVVIAMAVDQLVMDASNRLNPEALRRPATLWRAWGAFLAFSVLVFLTGPWAIAARLAPGPLPETLSFAPANWPFDVVTALGSFGRANYQAALVLDLLFPIFYVTAFGGIAWLLAKKSLPAPAAPGAAAVLPGGAEKAALAAARVAVAAALLTGATDVIENVFLLQLFAAQVQPEWSPLLVQLTTAKRMFGLTYFAAIAAIPLVRVGDAFAKWAWIRISLSPRVVALIRKRARAQTT